MSVKQIAAVLVPIILLAIMYATFRLLSRRFRDKTAWYSGLAIYWVVWGLVYPLLILGWDSVRDLFRPQSLDSLSLVLLLTPIIFAAIGRFILGIRYEKESRWAFLALLGTAFGNGIFEEVLWRGTYLELFPNSIVLRIIWPSLWFGLWHLAPGSVSSGSARNLALSSLFFGLLLSLLAGSTGTIFWTIVSHTLAGIVMIG